MPAQATESPRLNNGPLERHRVKIAAGVAALVLAASAAFPLAVVLLGVLLVALVGIDTTAPGSVPGLRALFRVPVAPASKRRARLLLAAGVGVLLVACGTAGAKFSGQLRTEWRLRSSQRLATERQVTEHLDRTREHLAAGEVELAELTLMDMLRIPAIGREGQREVDGLLDRIRRSGDSEAIRKVLLHLPPAEFETFVRGESVPKALEFQERALTYRAVALARTQIEEVQATRTRR